MLACFAQALFKTTGTDDDSPWGGGGHLIEKSDILAAGAGILTVQSSKIQNARGLLEGGNDEVSS